MFEKHLLKFSILWGYIFFFSSLLPAQNCTYTTSPDLPLLTSNATIEAEIDLIIERYRSYRFGDEFPSASDLQNAISEYDALNISISNGQISGETISNWSDLSYNFIRQFGQQLYQDPNDADIADKLNKVVWWLCQQYCDGTLATDTRMYSIDGFARNVVVLKEHLEPQVQDLFSYTIYRHSKEFEHFWTEYDEAYQLTNGAINTDMIHNLSDVLMLFGGWQDTPEERYRYMRGFQRWISRFCSYTYSVTNGIKPDGTAFHHWTAYTGYLNGYKTINTVVYHLRGTQFQIAAENYLILRDALYTMFVRSTEIGESIPLSLVGRNPHNRDARYKESTTRFLAIAGGEILNLPTPDPIVAGQAIRQWGAQEELVGMTATSSQEMGGFYQFNHDHAGAYRYDNWLAHSKGFSNNMWGTEIYASSNRYGRYQSYGTLEIMYPGNLDTGNGYDVATWDWNYPAGATTIVLPWDQLHAERERIDELQQKRLAGALTLQNKNSEVLNKTHGAYGIFAMDFQETTGLGWGTTHGPNTHNASFTFKKSNFFLDDIIISLGSNINNNDTQNPTVTTLYQRLDNTTNDVLVNGTVDNGTNAYSTTQDNWVISNYGTGFYIPTANSGTIDIWQGTQQTPNYNQTNPNDYINNATANYAKGYINHGTNPQNSEYEYITIPNADVTKMNTIATQMQNGNTLYEVHQKNNIAHILEYKPKNIWGYAFFEPTSNINDGVVKAVDHSSLVMTQSNHTDTLLLSITNPDIGFESREFSSAILKKIRVTLDGQWTLDNFLDNARIISSNPTETSLEFDTVDGLPIEVKLKREKTSLEIRAFLQGALVNSPDDLMRDDLRILNYIPVTEPYTDLSHFNHYGNGGGETINTTQLTDQGLASIVDWILVEIRDAIDPSIILETQAALIQRDGTVVNTQGESAISFNTNIPEFFVALRHRNHLGVMTLVPINPSQNNFIDFTDINTPTWGTHSQVEMGNGRQALWAGNSTIDNRLIFQGNGNEPSSIFFNILQATNNNAGPNFVTTGYLFEDVNLDGQCIFQGINNDTNLLFFNIVSFDDNTSNQPNYIIWEQLP